MAKPNERRRTKQPKTTRRDLPKRTGRTAAQKRLRNRTKRQRPIRCKGYDESLLNLFSTRTQQIEAVHRTVGNSAQRKRRKTPPSQPEKTSHTLATRLRKKSVPREVLLDGWHRAINTGEVTLPATPEAPQKELTGQAQTAAVEGVNHASERESVFRVERAERFALEHHLGNSPLPSCKQR